jgi:hypothetical protein
MQNKAGKVLLLTRRSLIYLDAARQRVRWALPLAALVSVAPEGAPGPHQHVLARRRRAQPKEDMPAGRLLQVTSLLGMEVSAPIQRLSAAGVRLRLL